MARFWVGFQSRGRVSRLAHLVLTILLPLLLYVLVRIEFVQIALLVVILSKWRMFAVRMRYWPAHIRSNAVDIMVGLSVVEFMASTSTSWWQLFWALLYGLWLLFIKPRSGMLWVSLQAAIAQGLALSALFMAWGEAPLYLLVLAVWLVCYLCARHFFTNFEESHTSLYAHTWGYFAAALTWVSGHWLLFYSQGLIAQPTLLLLVVGYGLATMYYLDHTERMTHTWRRQFVVIMVVVVAIILTFSDWGDRAL